MAEDAPEVVLDARAPYGPRILRRDGRLLFEIYVASGHLDRIEELPITERHAAVLCTDAERYWFLFTALHHPYQLASTRLSDARLGEYLDTVLCAPRAETERFLTDLDHGTANGALSNLLRIAVDGDHTRMRAGRWFGSIPTADSSHP